MKFKSAVDQWIIWLGLVLPIAAVVGALLLSGPLPGRDWVMVILILLLCMIIPLWLYFSTDYHVEDGLLTVRSGPFRWHIPLKEITSVTPSRSLLSAPALSMDRLEINYGTGRKILVSPRDKEAFRKAISA